MAKYAVVYYAPWKFRKSKWRLSMSSQFLINIQKWCERSSELINPSEFFFINNIFYNISSKSLRGSSRELTLFTLPNTRLDRTHKKSEKKHKHTHSNKEKRFDSETNDWTSWKNLTLIWKSSVKIPFKSERLLNQRVQLAILSLLKRISKESLAGNGLFF